MNKVLKNAPQIWKDALPDVGRFSHKYDRGQGVFFGGADMTGAICMSSYAATRMGLGLAIIISEKSAADVYRNYQPHIIVRTADTVQQKIGLLHDLSPDVVVIGPGYGRDPSLKDIVLAAVRRDNTKVILDADALSVFQDCPEILFESLNQNHILTPHSGEFSKLFENNGEKEERTAKAAELTGAVIVHKGQETVIAGPDGKVVVQNTDCPHLATAGTGDVLTGFITGLAGQKMTPLFASCAGVYLHAECGIKKGAGLVAPDLIEALPSVLKNYF